MTTSFSKSFQLSPYATKDEFPPLIHPFHGDSYLATGGLGEPQGPLVHEGVLHIEVLGVVEDGHDLIGRRGGRSGILIGHGRRAILGDGSHSEMGMKKGGWKVVAAVASEGKNFGAGKAPMRVEDTKETGQGK